MPITKSRAMIAEAGERADVDEVLDQQLDADDAEHDGDRLVEVAEAADQALDEHEQGAQAEQREDVAHPDQERVAGDREGGRDRVDRERDVGEDDRREAEEQRRRVAALLSPSFSFTNQCLPWNSEVTG